VITSKSANEVSVSARGELVLVGTPIGNLSDLSPNAVRALSEADVIACEDTRRTRKLLTHAGIHRRTLVTFNEHTEATKTDDLLDRVRAGKRVAVVSDAGMPGVSDPGERLVAAAVAGGIDVRVVPGPSAVITALVLSGLPTSRFSFEGFLPRKGKARQARLEALKTEARTMVIFEAPQRVRGTVGELADALDPERVVAVARELTKLHEEVWRGTLADAVQWLAAVEPRGEYVVVLAGAAELRTDATPEVVEDELRVRVAAGMSKRDAAAEVAAALGIPKRRAYEAATRL
jgi:16S rRNA (cytidine1402-2'-O)-methyltransferase